MPPSNAATGVLPYETGAVGTAHGLRVSGLLRQICGMVIRSGLGTWCLPSMADPRPRRSGHLGRIERPRFCSRCGNPVVVADASFCKNCGAALSATVWFSYGLPWRPMTAVILSAIPGLGHWYKGQRVRALSWFIFVVLFLRLDPWPLGASLWLICAFNAGVSGALREEA